jgi:metal-responsive CopG/Arc/MetJ family transcriptional regulator
MFSPLSTLHEETMPSTVAIVSPELSNRIVILLSDEMLKRLDEWRWENRISSRGEAVRQLVELGLESEPPKAEKSGK